MSLSRQAKFVQLAQRSEALLQAARRSGDLYAGLVFSLTLGFCRLLAGRVSDARELVASGLELWTDDYTIQHFYALRLVCYCDLHQELRDSARDRIEAEWDKICGSDVFLIPSAKMDAYLLRSHVMGENSSRSIRRIAGREAATHARYVDALLSGESTDHVARLYRALEMPLWCKLADGDTHIDTNDQVACVLDVARRLFVPPTSERSSAGEN